MRMKVSCVGWSLMLVGVMDGSTPVRSTSSGVFSGFDQMRSDFVDCMPISKFVLLEMSMSFN